MAAIINPTTTALGGLATRQMADTRNVAIICIISPANRIGAKKNPTTDNPKAASDPKRVLHRLENSTTTTSDTTTLDTILMTMPHLRSRSIEFLCRNRRNEHESGVFPVPDRARF